MCVLSSSTEKKDSPSLTEHVVATTANQTVAQLKNPTTRTPRSLEMRLAMNNDIMGDEDLMSYTPNLTSILGSTFFYNENYNIKSLMFHRSRPLYIPTISRQGHNYESNHQSEEHDQQQSAVEIQQLKVRPNRLFLPTKQFEDGHANLKSQTSYIEQFWICTKRYEMF